jgi:hypothetical protein
MTDIIDAEYEMTEKKVLTVGQFIEDMAKFPQDSELVAAIEGINLTIPITGAMAVDTKEGVKIVVLVISADGANHSMTHGNNMAQMKALNGEEVVAN